MTGGRWRESMVVGKTPAVLQSPVQCEVLGSIDCVVIPVGVSSYIVDGRDVWVLGKASVYSGLINLQNRKILLEQGLIGIVECEACVLVVVDVGLSDRVPDD